MVLPLAIPEYACQPCRSSPMPARRQPAHISATLNILCITATVRSIRSLVYWAVTVEYSKPEELERLGLLELGVSHAGIDIRLIGTQVKRQDLARLFG